MVPEKAVDTYAWAPELLCFASKRQAWTDFLGEGSRTGFNANRNVQEKKVNETANSFYSSYNFKDRVSLPTNEWCLQKTHLTTLNTILGETSAKPCIGIHRYFKQKGQKFLLGLSF